MTRTPFPSAHIAAISPCHRARHRLRIYVSGHPLGYLSFTRHKYTRHEFGVVIRQLNARFDTHFAELTHSDANVQECLEFSRLRETDSPTLLGFESGWSPAIRFAGSSNQSEQPFRGRNQKRGSRPRSASGPRRRYVTSGCSLPLPSSGTELNWCTRNSWLGSHGCPAQDPRSHG